MRTILIILLAFNAGFLAGALWDSCLKKRSYYILFVLSLVALALIGFFENLPAMVHNLFYRTKRTVQWDPMARSRGHCE